MIESKMETLGIRPTEYSEWHRSLPPEIKAVDIDWVEYREGIGIVALIATTGNLEDIHHMMNSLPTIWDRTEVERKALRALAFAVGVQPFYVVHTKNCENFIVINLEKCKTKDEFVNKGFMMTEKLYREFILNLGK